MSDIENGLKNIQTMYNPQRIINAEKVAWALLMNDKDEIAKFRLIKRKLDAESAKKQREFNAASIDEEKLAVLGSCSLASEIINCIPDEIRDEKKKMKEEARDERSERI